MEAAIISCSIVFILICILVYSYKKTDKKAEQQEITHQVNSAHIITKDELVIKQHKAEAELQAKKDYCEQLLKTSTLLPKIVNKINQYLAEGYTCINYSDIYYKALDLEHIYNEELYDIVKQKIRELFKNSDYSIIFKWQEVEETYVDTARYTIRSDNSGMLIGKGGIYPMFGNSTTTIEGPSEIKQRNAYHEFLIIRSKRSK